jgi:hypothetical protein
VVAALWGLAALWIVVNPLTGDHSNATTRCLQSITLLLVSAAGTTLFAWLIQYLIIEPNNTSTRTFELGYYAGRADALAMLDEYRAPLAAVSEFPALTGHTGT